MCIDKDYRNRGIAKYFLKQASIKVFKPMGYSRVTFQVSNFNEEALKACEKKPDLIEKIWTWPAFTFIFGVTDERTVYAFNIDSQVYKI
jgi:GNAT superfamily N-acetyltransferase